MERNNQKSKLGELNTWKSNAPKDLGGGFNKKSGTRQADKLSSTNKMFQGTVKGKTTHTYKGE